MPTSSSSSRYAPVDAFLGRQVFGHGDRFGNLVAYGAHRVEGIHRALEDD